MEIGDDSGFIAQLNYMSMEDRDIILEFINRPEIQKDSSWNYLLNTKLNSSWTIKEVLSSLVHFNSIRTVYSHYGDLQGLSGLSLSNALFSIFSFIIMTNKVSDAIGKIPAGTEMTLFKNNVVYKVNKAEQHINVSKWEDNNGRYIGPYLISMGSLKIIKPREFPGVSFFNLEVGLDMDKIYGLNRQIKSIKEIPILYKINAEMVNDRGALFYNTKITEATLDKLQDIKWLTVNVNI